MISNMFNAFRKPISIQGKGDEKAVFTRVGRSNSSNFKSNFVYTALLKDNSKLENGDVFTCNFHGRKRTFLTISVRTTDQSIQATVYECNCTVKVQRLSPKFDQYDNQIGNEIQDVLAVPANYVTVNAAMRTFDAGLLKSTTKEFRMPKCDIKLLDRLVLDVDGSLYCVDVVDETKFAGLLSIQTSEDNRSL